MKSLTLFQCFSFCRILSMAVAFRYDQMVDESLTKRMFGHPYLIYVHSRLSGEALYNMVDRVVPLTVSYTILLTDGQVRAVIKLTLSQKICLQIDLDPSS